jgi:predicted nucleic acid-binding Zn ribbon protein
LTYATDDLCEGVLAVKQKRKPNFTGNWFFLVFSLVHAEVCL